MTVGAFLAIEDSSDNHHQKAISFWKALLEKKNQVVTTDYVLDETYTIIRIRAGHKFAVEFGEETRRSKIIKIIHITPGIIDNAWKVFKKYQDKDFSFTDCTSFVAMKENKIESAFSFDKNFTQYGFKILP